MAYTITTNTPVREMIDGEMRETTRGRTTRRTAVSLAEVVRVLNATGADWSLDGINGEGGGKVTLPDGTMIEVSRS
jgi:hypothetical protein